MIFSLKVSNLKKPFINSFALRIHLFHRTIQKIYSLLSLISDNLVLCVSLCLKFEYYPHSLN